MPSHDQPLTPAPDKYKGRLSTGQLVQGLSGRMLRLFRTYRTAGIKVSASVHRDIAAANRARDAGQWGEAANLYDRVLAGRPDLVHLRIQQGHALKEDGRWDEAASAYRAALATAPDDRDAALHLAHALKLLGDRPAAADLYMALALRDDSDEEAMREVRDLLSLLPDAARRTMAARLVERIGEHVGPATDAGGYPPLAVCELAFDACDLISFFSHSRRPTGIQRVQIEVLTEALRAAARGKRAAGVCCFLDGRDCWVEVPAAALLEVMRLSGASGPAQDSQWQRRRDALHLHLLVAEPVEFREGATLVNLGTSWWLHNYFLALRDMQERRGIAYVPMIHDMIPVVLPELCLEPVVRDFVGWVTGIFDHSATFLANSQATKRDLLAVAASMGRPLAPEAVEVVPLDALPPSVAGAGTAPLPEAVGDGPIVLFVATIEPRKGHVTAFDAWARLVERLGQAATPRLVCVGRKGWHHEPILARLEGSPALRERVVLLADLDEAMLAALYERCLFTIYPSLYEGWGLPVTEALARGKPVITTTSSSLPEAGGEFALYTPSEDAELLADASMRLIVDVKDREALAARIARGFAPRPWATVATELCAAAARLGARPEARRGSRPPIASLDRFHPIGRSTATHLELPFENGERFRAGRGWLISEDWGCRVAKGGGRLAFTLSPEIVNGGPLTLAVRLVAPREAPCPFSVGAVAGDLAPGERRTVSLPLDLDANGVADVRIAGMLSSDRAREARDTTVGVEGFAAHRDTGGPGGGSRRPDAYRPSACKL